MKLSIIIYQFQLSFGEKAKPIFIEFLCAADDEGPSHAPQQQQCEEKVYKLSKRKPFFSITINVSLASCNSILLSCSFSELHERAPGENCTFPQIRMFSLNNVAAGK
jgi:hypothetical protein